MVLKFRHQISNANFMVGLLDGKDEMCDICYTRAKDNPPSKEEIDKHNVKILEDAEKMRMDMFRI